MISMYTGTPGSGKSYHTTAVIERNLFLHKRTVISTYQINMDNLCLTKLGWLKTRITKRSNGKIVFKNYNRRELPVEFHYIHRDKLTVKYLEDFAYKHHNGEKEGETLLIIDEAQRKFNCRDYQYPDRKAWLDFLPEHRHWGYDIILACPSDRELDRQVRVLCEYEVTHRKVRNFKTLGLIMATLVGGNLFLCKTYWYASRKKDYVSQETLRYKKRIACIYNYLDKFERPGAAAARSGAGVPARTVSAPEPPPHVTQTVDGCAPEPEKLQENLCNNERGEGQIVKSEEDVITAICNEFRGNDAFSASV